MDRTELKKRLVPFKERCAEKGRPLIGLCLEEAYPGDSSTSFIVQVKAHWFDGLSCSEIIDFLFDILWETTDVATRTKIFYLQILDGSDELRCVSDALLESEALQQ